DGGSRVPDRAAALAARVDDGLAAAAVVGDPSGAPGRGGCQGANRWPGPERRPGGDRGAAARLLPAVLRRHPRERRHRELKLELERRKLQLARPLQSSYGSIGERELII